MGKVSYLCALQENLRLHRRLFADQSGKDFLREKVSKKTFSASKDLA